MTVSSIAFVALANKAACIRLCVEDMLEIEVCMGNCLLYGCAYAKEGQPKQVNAMMGSSAAQLE